MLQGGSVLETPPAGVLPGCEGEEQTGVGQLGKRLLQRSPVEALAVADGLPSLKHLWSSGHVYYEASNLKERQHLCGSMVGLNSLGVCASVVEIPPGKHII